MKLKNPFKNSGARAVRTADDDDLDDIASVVSGDENKQRGNWSNQFEFLLSCVSYAVGLGNIWRFPYLCMRNGGGAFLIPYFTFMFLCGMPLFYLELGLGQFSSLSALSVWNISPVFKGVGIATIIVTGIVSIYYNLILAWVLYYLFHSFTATLPWGTCDNSWNTDRCLARHSLVVDHANSSMLNMTSWNATLATPVYDLNENSTKNITKFNTPAEEFWHYNVLEISSGIDELGGIQWKMMGCLVASWVIVFLCIIKGVKSSGKVVYVTATVPYLFLSVLLIRGLTLPGSADGIKYYVTPDWHRLLEFKVWVEACLQIFYSLGPGWGSLITMASYNRFNNKMHYDSLLVPLINCGTSFFAGFVIFAIIGFMAKDAGLSVEDVVTTGPGLAFIAYPEALNRLPISPMWAVMFFVMLINIGLGTQFAMVETVSSGFIDQFPRLLQVFKKKFLFTAFVCVVMFLISIPLVTKAGVYFFQIVDWYSAALAVQIITVLECVVVCFVYGIRRYNYDIECMIGKKPNIVLNICWACVTPALIVIVLIISLKDFPQPYYGDYRYPAWAIGMGWGIACCSFTAIPVYAVWYFLKSDGSILQRMRQISRPAAGWGPALTQHREHYKYNIAAPIELLKDQNNTEKPNITATATV